MTATRPIARRRRSSFEPPILRCRPAIGTRSASTHAAISAADALLAYFGGVRSTGEHNDVIGLLAQHVKDDQLSSKTQTLAKVLGYKNLAAYEDREVTEAEGREAAKLARRFVEWAQSRLV